MKRIFHKSYISELDLCSDVHALKFLKQEFTGIGHLDAADALVMRVAIGAVIFIAKEAASLAHIHQELIT